MLMKVINDNFAPNGLAMPTDSGDCCIRACSYALGISYVKICKVFGIKYDRLLKCADSQSLRDNPITFKRIREANLGFSRHRTFLKSDLTRSQFLKRAWSLDKFIENRPDVFQDNKVVVYLFPRSLTKRGHTVAVINGVVHDNRPNGSPQQLRELTMFAVFGYSVV